MVRATFLKVFAKVKRKSCDSYNWSIAAQDNLAMTDTSSTSLARSRVRSKQVPKCVKERLVPNPSRGLQPVPLNWEHTTTSGQ